MTLFLLCTLSQIFYLDNIDNGSNTPQHDCLPRIKAFNDRIMSELIQSDTVLPNRIPFPSYGKLKVPCCTFMLKMLFKLVHASHNIYNLSQLRERHLVCYGNRQLTNEN